MSNKVEDLKLFLFTKKSRQDKICLTNKWGVSCSAQYGQLYLKSYIINYISLLSLKAFPPTEFHSWKFSILNFSFFHTKYQEYSNHLPLYGIKILKEIRNPTFDYLGTVFKRERPKWESKTSGIKAPSSACKIELITRQRRWHQACIIFHPCCSIFYNSTH